MTRNSWVRYRKLSQKSGKETDTWLKSKCYSADVVDRQLQLGRDHYQYPVPVHHDHHHPDGGNRDPQVSAE